jgi:hypothetical protein
MIEDVIALLDQLGVDYDEDYETELLTISIADVDKEGVVEIISALLTNELEFDISETDITVTLSDDDVDLGEEYVDDVEEMDEFALDEYLEQ